MTDAQREQWFTERLTAFALEAKAAGLGEDDQESIERIACAFLTSGVRLLIMTGGSTEAIHQTVDDLIALFVEKA